jgi:hypothetical protein
VAPPLERPDDRSPWPRTALSRWLRLCARFDRPASRTLGGAKTTRFGGAKTTRRRHGGAEPPRWRHAEPTSRPTSRIGVRGPVSLLTAVRGPESPPCGPRARRGPVRRSTGRTEALTAAPPPNGRIGAPGASSGPPGALRGATAPRGGWGPHRCLRVCGWFGGVAGDSLRSDSAEGCHTARRGIQDGLRPPQAVNPGHPDARRGRAEPAARPEGTPRSSPRLRQDAQVRNGVRRRQRRSRRRRWRAHVHMHPRAREKAPVTGYRLQVP